MLELVLPDRTRFALSGDLTIGRASSSTVRLADPTVSRVHARIKVTGDAAPVLEDAGSSYGTWLDGRRLEGPAELHAGARLRVGEQELVVDRLRADEEAGRTIVVPDTMAPERTGPRLRAGAALKRLDAAEGDRRWVLQDAVSGTAVRLGDDDAALVLLADGTRQIDELVHDAEQRLGPGGPARLSLLLASLGARGFLDEEQDGAAEPMGWRRWLRPRHVTWSAVPGLIDRLSRHGGRLLLTRPALVLLAALAAGGAAAFVGLIVGRYGTPFVVAHKVGIGGLVFIAGRLAVASVHEFAHGLVLASYGRRVREAGLKLVLVFPYLYVDTSQAWLEPRRHRIAVSAAGPASDLCLAGCFALACLVAPAGAPRDVAFQLAFGAYLGAFFNLNPLVERDGYQILVDLLREPGLRRRARGQLRRRVAGTAGGEPVRRALVRYGQFGLAWSVVAAVGAGVLSLRYARAVTGVVPAPVVWSGMAMAWAALLTPVLTMVGSPLRDRLRARKA